MKKDMSFEEAILKLEDTVESLEGGELTLDESIKAYEEAMKLVGICNSALEKAELKVKILTEGKDGEVSDAPFDVSGDAN